MLSNFELETIVVYIFIKLSFLTFKTNLSFKRNKKLLFMFYNYSIKYKNKL